MRVPKEEEEEWDLGLGKREKEGEAAAGYSGKAAVGSRVAEAEGLKAKDLGAVAMVEDSAEVWWAAGVKTAQEGGRKERETHFRMVLYVRLAGAGQ